MKDFRTFLDILVIVFNPKYWGMNYSYNYRWDIELNRLMENNNFVFKSKHESMLGGITMWVENHPYASFTMPKKNNQHIFDFAGGRPSRLTIIRAKRKWKYDLLGVGEKRELQLSKLGI